MEYIHSNNYPITINQKGGFISIGYKNSLKNIIRGEQINIDDNLSDLMERFVYTDPAEICNIPGLFKGNGNEGEDHGGDKDYGGGKTNNQLSSFISLHLDLNSGVFQNFINTINNHNAQIEDRLQKLRLFYIYCNVHVKLEYIHMKEVPDAINESKREVLDDLLKFLRRRNKKKFSLATDSSTILSPENIQTINKELSDRYEKLKNKEQRDKYYLRFQIENALKELPYVYNIGSDYFNEVFKTLNQITQLQEIIEIQKKDVIHHHDDLSIKNVIEKEKEKREKLTVLDELIKSYTKDKEQDIIFKEIRDIMKYITKGMDYDLSYSIEEMIDLSKNYNLQSCEAFFTYIVKYVKKMKKSKDEGALSIHVKENKILIGGKNSLMHIRELTNLIVEKYNNSKKGKKKE